MNTVAEKGPLEGLRELTLHNIDEIERCHNFWVAHVARLGVASDATMLQDHCAVFETLDVALDALKEVVKKAEALKAVLNHKILVKGFEVVGVPAQYVGDIEFATAQRITGSFTDKQKGFDWLEEIGEEALIQRTVHAQTLSAFLTRYVKDEAKTPPPEVVKISTLDYIKINRPTAKKGRRKNG
jgi:hypothetical protein